MLNRKRFLSGLMLLSVLLPITMNGMAVAVDNPQSGSIGLEGTITSAPPTTAASITTPANGANLTTLPITVSGLCPSGVLVKLFANNVFIGSTVCTKGSFELQADLFSGRNDLVARVYDALDQAGPDSNVVSVNFTDAQFLSIGARVTLTSNYARRGANPGDELDWPITLAGGSPPYALSVDWGDGKSPDLLSQSFTGTVTLKHVYSSAGTYSVIVKASDAQDSTAFLQLVGVANGAVQASANGKSTQTLVRTVVIWWPLLLALPLLIISFWLGRRHELFTLRKHLESQL